jgi:GMP synthase (glutamine-hydrolysing)
MRVHYVMHVTFETPGIIENWARDRGYQFTGTLTSGGERLPNAADIDFLIVMGGPQSPMRTDEYPYLKDEMELVSEIIQQHKPVIGFCLGSQVIAEALAAPTQQSPNKEVGFFPVQLTEDGRRDPVLKDLPAEFEALHWHYDMPGIPLGAVLLAKSAGCPHQAFRFGDRVYGFQFHMEPTRDSTKPLLKKGADDLAPSQYTQTAEEIMAADFESMNRRMIYILDTITKISGQ